MEEHMSNPVYTYRGFLITLDKVGDGYYHVNGVVCLTLNEAIEVINRHLPD